MVKLGLQGSGRYTVNLTKMYVTIKVCKPDISKSCLCYSANHREDKLSVCMFELKICNIEIIKVTESCRHYTTIDFTRIAL